MQLAVMRATEPWQRAGAHYVRIQAMARKYHITLREEFDEHDTDATRYVVLLDDDFPVGTCRFYELDRRSVMVGRVVVLEEYRRRGLGRRLLAEAEAWAAELGYATSVLESRVSATGFYASLGYVTTCPDIVNHGTFDCVRMEKSLRPGRQDGRSGT